MCKAPGLLAGRLLFARCRAVDVAAKGCGEFGAGLAWLADFMQIVERQSGATFEVMGHTLKLDAACRSILATVIALITPLGTECKLSGGNSVCPEFS